MSTNKMRKIIFGGKVKDIVALIKSLIYMRIGRGTVRACYNILTKVDRSCKLIKVHSPKKAVHTMLVKLTHCMVIVWPFKGCFLKLTTICLNLNL